MTEEFDRSFNEHMRFTDAIRDQSHLGAVLIIAAYIDDKLRRIIDVFLVEDRVRNDLFKGPQAPIGSFSSRINLAYAMALISEREFTSISAMRKIRNKFAHNIDASFKDQSIRSHLDALAWSVGRDSLGKSGAFFVFRMAAEMIGMQLLNRVDHVQKARLVDREWDQKRTDYDPDYDPY